MPAPVYILFGALYTIALATALGKLLLRRLDLRLCYQEEHLLSFVVGTPLLSALVFLLCVLHVARKGVLLWVGIAILAWAWRRGVHRPRGESLPPLDIFWKRLFTVPFIIFAVLYVSNAMAPEISPDGSSYHLALVARYLRERGFHPITTNMYASLSQGVEMLFLFAFAFGRHSAAALVHCAFLLVLPLAMLCYARRFGIAPAGVCAALLVFLSPVVGIDGVSGYIDVALATIVFCLFYLLQIWEEQRLPAAFVPIGLLAGFAYAAKYTAVLGVPYALGFLVWGLRGRRAAWLRPVLVVGLCALAVMLPWLLKNWLWVHNPVSPFFNSLFPNPYVTPGFEQDYVAFLRHYGITNKWRIPLQVTVGGSLSGALGPVFLLAPVGLLALAQPLGRRLWLAALVFGLSYLSNIGTRFLLPMLPFVALAMAMSILNLGRAGKYACAALVVVHALLSWPDILARYTGPETWRLTKVTWREALRIKPEEGFLHSNLPGYDMARTIERIVPPGGKVFTFSGLPEAYTTREVLVGYEAAFNRTLLDMLWTPLGSDKPPTWLLQFRFPSQNLRRVRVVQSARGEPDYWSVSEMRVFQGGLELPRMSEWRLRAHPNPWYVQLAFDNSPVTRWSSQQTLFPGMFLEIDFGKPQTIDGVLLACSHDQYKVRLRLEGQDPAGKWKSLVAAPEQAEQAPLVGLRRAAIEELKARGLGYMVVASGDYYEDDFRKNSSLWGIREMGENGGYRLYLLL